MTHEFNDIALLVEPERYSAILRMQAESRVPQWAGRKTENIGSTGIVPVFGIIDEDGSSWAEQYYTFASKLVPRIHELAADPAITSIVLLMNTPGGSCKACEKISAAVQAAAKVKPVETFIDGMCCSAGVHIAAYTNKVTSTPSSIVGSIGVIATYYDYSKLFEEIGIKAHVLTTGKMKAMGVPGAAITEDQKQTRMKLIESLCDEFKLVLMDQRNLSEETVNKLAEKGDIWTAKQSMAQNLGLVDAIGQWDEFIQQRTGGSTTGGTAVQKSQQSQSSQQGEETMSLKEREEAILKACPGLDKEKHAAFLHAAFMSEKSPETIGVEWKDKQHADQLAAKDAEIAALKAEKPKEVDAPTPPAPGGSALHTEQKEETSGNPEKAYKDALHRIQKDHHARGETCSLGNASRILERENPALRENYFKSCKKNPRKGFLNGWSETADTSDRGEIEFEDDED